jgi:GntR family histidine utilization transcriptional repressor
MPNPGKPRYQELKDRIIQQISGGDLRPGDRVPSENELVLASKVSRMTANRALRELTDEGYVERIAGRGTFVSDLRAHSHVREIQNIADEIASRGNDHSCTVMQTSRKRATGEAALALHADADTDTCHVQLVHFENDVPIQVEDRYIVADFAPDCLLQDFQNVTPSAYLTSISPLQEAEQVVRAEMPVAEVRKWLQMASDEPALVILRRTWVSNRPVSFARLQHPGSRYELTGHYRPYPTQSTSEARVVQLEGLNK